MKDPNDTRTTDIAGAPATQPDQSKPKKPRAMSKKVQALVDAAREKGFNEGINRPRDNSGLLIWPLLAFIAGVFAHIAAHRYFG